MLYVDTDNNTRQAYANVCQELQSAMTEFGDAMAVMADKRAEESEGA